MSNIGKTDTAGWNVWHQAPLQGTTPTSGAITGVWAPAEDEVEWTWTHTSQGSYVTGYTIRKSDKGKSKGG